VRHAAGESAPEPFNVAVNAVGIFQFPGTNRAVALNQNGSVNGPDNPEARGNVIVVFLTGQGPISPPVPTGRAAAADPLSSASLRATANIGRAAADVKFLGLTPGFVGLAQANIEVPAGAAAGSEVVMFISVDGQAGNTATVSIR
jgi:adhesin/invasin